jgi:AraC-like DNA-binding protein
MYRERASTLPGAVLWHARSRGASRILPDGCLDLIWAAGEFFVAGPDTVGYVTEDSPETEYFGLRFAPGSGPAVVGVPARELCDRRVPLGQLWPAARVRALTDRMRTTAGSPATVLETAAAKPARPDLTDSRTPAIVAHLRRGQSVTATAAAVGLSERQLHRRSQIAFGYGPKTLHRILRMRRAVALARAGRAFAEVATETGYADQAHLAREVRTLAGVPLGELSAE